MLITIQSRRPWISGLMPTARSTSFESDAPMKNIVRVKHRRAMLEMIVPTSGTASRTNVFKSIAAMKYRMNHGMVILRSLLLNMNDVASAKGMIHRALVSLMVVATFRASSPYAAPAPTTELVSWMAMAAQVPNSC